MKKKGKAKRNGKAKRKPAKRSIKRAARAAPKMIPPNEMVDVGPSGRR